MLAKSNRRHQRYGSPGVRVRPSSLITTRVPVYGPLHLVMERDYLESYFEAQCSPLGPQVEPQEKKKTPKGRAKKRITYTRRFVNVTMTGGKRKVRNYGHRYTLDFEDVVPKFIA